MDTCQLQPGLCARRVESAMRAAMPQVDEKALFRWARKEAFPKYLVERANRRALTAAETRILAELDAMPPRKIKGPVRITLGRTRLCDLTVTQREARHSIVEALAKDIEHGKAITKETPILISYGPKGTFKVIDGHHRFLAHKLQSARSKTAPKTVHTFLIHLPQADALRIGWAASTETHHF